MRRGRLVNTLLAGMIALSALFIPLELLDNSIPEATAITVALMVMLFALVISGRGDPTLAAYLFIGTCCAIISADHDHPVERGVGAPLPPFMFAIPIIAAGVTAQRRAAFAVAGLAPGW